MRLLLPAALMATLMVGTAAAPREAVISDRGNATYALSGTVFEEPGLSPLAGVLIEVESSPRVRAVTDSSGTYRIDSVPPGTHFVTARAPGYLPERRRVELFCRPPVTRGTQEVVAGRCAEADQSLSFFMRLAFVH